MARDTISPEPHELVGLPVGRAPVLLDPAFGAEAIDAHHAHALVHELLPFVGHLRYDGPALGRVGCQTSLRRLEGGLVRVEVLRQLDRRGRATGRGKAELTELQKLTGLLTAPSFLWVYHTFCWT